MLTICAAFALLTLVAASPLLVAEVAQRRFLTARQDGGLGGLCP